MSDKMVLCFIILAMFACVSVLFDILSRWFDVFIAYLKKDKYDLSITFASRGSGENNFLKRCK